MSSSRNVDPTDAQDSSQIGVPSTDRNYIPHQEQKLLAEASKSELDASGRFRSPVVTLCSARLPRFSQGRGVPPGYSKRKLTEIRLLCRVLAGRLSERIWKNEQPLW